MWENAIFAVREWWKKACVVCMNQALVVSRTICIYLTKLRDIENCLGWCTFHVDRCGLSPNGQKAQYTCPLWSGFNVSIGVDPFYTYLDSLCTNMDPLCTKLDPLFMKLDLFTLIWIHCELIWIMCVHSPSVNHKLTRWFSWGGWWKNNLHNDNLVVSHKI